MRLWEDGFDHYGTTLAKMLDGPYAQAEACALTNAQFVTGVRSILFNSNGGLNNPRGLRKVLPTAIDKIGVAARFYFPALPSAAYESCIFDFLTTDSLRSQLGCFVDSNGAVRFVRGNQTYAETGAGSPFGGTLIATSDPLLTANSWNHIEVQVYIHATLGWVRVAVNGVQRFEATGLNTQYDTTKIASVMQRRPYNGTTGNGQWYMDDYYMYDFTGTAATDTDFCPTVDGAGKATSFIGELQVWPLFPNADTAAAAWQKSTGVVGYSLINENTPDDAGYVYSTVSADLSEFALDDLPSNITYVRGLGIHARMSKSDAGAAMIKLGMKSVAAVTDAAERPVTTTPTYWRDTVNVDPNSTARWTRASLNAGLLRITRSV